MIYGLQGTKRAGMLRLTALIFATVCGGAYGVEAMVGDCGPKIALGFLLFTPLLWAAPIIFIVIELNRAIPAEGGYYIWVRSLLGQFWGLQIGWLTLCYTCVDLALYPVLFVEYLSYLLPRLQSQTSVGDLPMWIVRWGIAASFVGVSFLVQRLGIRKLASGVGISNLISMGPFLLLIGIALARVSNTPIVGPLASATLQPNANTILIAIGTSIWLYSGWDNVATYAEEIESPGKTYRRGLWFALALVTVAYVGSVAAGLSITRDPVLWKGDHAWPQIASLSGYDWLPLCFLASALFSAWSLFNGQLLYASRLPAVMAKDGWLPRGLTATSVDDVPVRALSCVCAGAVLLCPLSFFRLIIVEVLLYCVGLAIQLAAFLVLRSNSHSRATTFRRGRNIWSLAIAALPFVWIVAAVTMCFTSFRTNAVQILITFLCVVAGPTIFRLGRDRVLER